MPLVQIECYLALYKFYVHPGVQPGIKKYEKKHNKKKWCAFFRLESFVKVTQRYPGFPKKKVPRNFLSVILILILII